MKKFTIFILAVLMTFLMVSSAPAASKDFWADVYRWDGKMSNDGKPVLTRATTGITFKVLQAGSDSTETLTYRGGTTSLTNPVTTTNFESDTVCADRVAFRTDPTHSGDENVDLIVVDTVGGYTAFVEDFTQYEHTIIIDERPGVLHHGMIWFTATAAETDTGIDFDYDTLISDIRVEVVTPGPNVTFDVGILSSGTGGDADGLIKDQNLTPTGFRYDSGTTTTYYGALMSFDPTKGTRDHGHIVTGANEQSLTHTASSATGAGYIHYWFTRMR